MRIKSRRLIQIAGRFGSLVTRSIFRTLNKDLHFAAVNPYDSSSAQHYLFSVWHDSSILAAFGGKHKRTVALTSRHSDGSFVESMLAGIKVPTVRGSTGKTGTRAARELLNVAQKHDIVMVPDGPRGPAHQMSRGIVYLASRSGSHIVPTAFKCDKFWEIRSSWTSHIIPKPWSRIVLLAGEPIAIRPNIPVDDLEPLMQQVQTAMDNLQDVAERQLIRPVEDPLGTYCPTLRNAA